ncbi:hypothetical protein QCA50_001047 [Cerrena zonata]|uniref:F-box domain-containing protein n=1 Tax=Cerrena zonata TaxID=2478898 RepID=A0AAW0GYY9_9APHY
MVNANPSSDRPDCVQASHLTFWELDLYILGCITTLTFNFNTDKPYPLRMDTICRGILRLNSDVLLLIADHLTSKECLRLASTCKQLQAILSDEAVRQTYITTCERLKGFLRFILLHPCRSHCVRTLVIQDRDTHETPKVLTEVLLHTTNLSELVLSFKYEDALKNYLPLLGAINILPCLTRLQVRKFGPMALKGFLEMRSRLRSLELFKALPEAMDGIFPQGGALETLEKLTLRGCSTDDDDVIAGSNAVWPTVRSLQVCDTDVCLQDLVEYFPNVRKFTMRGVGFQFHPFNQTMSKSDLWPNLDHFIPYWPDLVTYGRNLIVFPVRRLTFLNTFEDICAVHDDEQFRTLLQDIQPIVLSFPAIADNPDHTTIPLRLQVPQPVWKNLRCLTVSLLESSKIDGIYSWIYGLEDSIGELSLLSFCLSIYRPYDVPLQDIQANLDSSTPNHIPTMLYGILKHTRFIGVDFSSQHNLRPYWWCAIQEETLFIRIPDNCNYSLTKALHKMDGTPEGLSRVKRALPRSILDLIPQDDDGNILSCKIL